MFYHVSRNYLGKTVTLVPKVPETAHVDEEGNIPRICVCPSVYGCLRGIVSVSKIAASHVLGEFVMCTPFDSAVGSPELKRFIPFPSVYSTKETPYKPPKASDFRRTKEHWFLSPTTMQHEGYLDLESIWRSGDIKITPNFGSLSFGYYADLQSACRDMHLKPD